MPPDLASDFLSRLVSCQHRMRNPDKGAKNENTQWRKDSVLHKWF